MYYITNQDDHIIAADSNLLLLLNIKDLAELCTKIIHEEITFLYLSDKNVVIQTPYSEDSYTYQKTELTSLLGKLTLFEVKMLADEIFVPEKTFETEIKKHELSKSDETNPFTIAEPDDIFNIDGFNNDDLVSAKEFADQDLSVPLKNNEDQLLLLVDDSIHLELPQNASLPEKEKNDDLFDLILPDEADEHISEIQTEGQQKFNAQAESACAIKINVAQLSKKIGISVEDYTIFLNEYIDTALMLEEDLQDADLDKQKNAIETLLHLSNVLGLPAAVDILTQIDKAKEDDKKTLIKSFYTVLSRLTTHTQPEEDHNEFTVNPETEADIQSKSEPLFRESFGTIDLTDVKPIHFDFQLEQAANDLNLPAELINEFVHDFIKQAHAETQKMLRAYQKGDLPTIQKIGHLLKGVSSNLRIDPLASTLYDIQFCEDSSRLEDLIKRYWGHFLSFETQINLTSR